jgi:hypothetical protein
VHLVAAAPACADIDGYPTRILPRIAIEKTLAVDFANLLAAACHALPGGKRMEIATDAVLVAASRQGNLTRVDGSDRRPSGAGDRSTPVVRTGAP